MFDFLQQLKTRNETLFYFGVICFVLSVLFLVGTKFSSTQVYGVSAWYKPFKFAFSTMMYVWAMAWYLHYLPDFRMGPFNWTIVVLLGFEIVYIALQAGRGQISHYNSSTPFYSTMFALMGIAATLVTLYTAYVGYLFCVGSFHQLPVYYLWSIRLAIFIFVVFSFEGFAMGARLSHSVGAINDNSNWFVVGWSKTVGDLRVAHFIGMHALQILPLLSFYVVKNVKGTIVVSILYGLLALGTLIQALQGHPLVRSKTETNTGL